MCFSLKCFFLNSVSSAAVLNLTCHCVHTLTPRGNREMPESGIYFKIYENNTIFNEHPVPESSLCIPFHSAVLHQQKSPWHIIFHLDACVNGWKILFMDLRHLVVTSHAHTLGHTLHTHTHTHSLISTQGKWLKLISIDRDENRWKMVQGKCCKMKCERQQAFWNCELGAFWNWL